jgi:vancomycin resistance protein VanW
MKYFKKRQTLEPIQRSKARLLAGKLYYTLCRYALWYSGRIKFAERRTSECPLQYIYVSHKTPLLRDLKDVEEIYHHNKIINLKTAVKQLNGIILKPGEHFSYWKWIGKPAKRKGYVPGMVLFCGSYRMGMGGGLCQLSNLIYWMTLHTPLTVVERYRHSYDVFPDSNRTQPFGSGATCVYPYRDLMIKNETDTAFQLRVQVGEKYLEGAWLSAEPPEFRYEVAEKNHLFKGEYWGGFSRHNELYRKKFTLDGELVEEEYITENHALMMYVPFLSSVSEEKKEGES